MTEQTRCDLQVELSALRQKLGTLEAAHRELLGRASRSPRPGWSRKFLLGVLPVMLLLAMGGLLYGQGGGDALFIDPQGNVGIGTTDPKTKLHVAGDYYGRGHIFLHAYEGDGKDGTAYLQGRDDSGKSSINLQLRTQNKGTIVDSMRLNADGHVGIRTKEPKNALDVNGGVVIGAEFAGSKKAPSDGVIIKGQVGIGKEAPLQPYTLDVEGSVRIKEKLFIDGEKKDNPKISFRGEATANGSIIWDQEGGRHFKFWAVGSANNQGLASLQSGALEVIASHNADEKYIAQFFPESKTQGIGIGYRTIAAIGSNSDQDIIIRPKGNGVIYLDGPVGVKNVAPGHGAKVNYGRLVLYSNKHVAWDDSVNKQSLSDERLKTDLRQIPNAINKVRRIRGVTYHWNETGLQYLTKDIETTISAGPEATAAQNQKLWQKERHKRYKELSKSNIGVIAQEVEKVLPEAVSTDEVGYKSVRYYYLIPLLIEALKEQDKTVRDQARLVAQQHQEIARLTAANRAVQQRLTELNAMKARVAQLEAVVQRVTATQAVGTSDAVAHLSVKEWQRTKSSEPRGTEKDSQ